MNCSQSILNVEPAMPSCFRGASGYALTTSLGNGNHVSSLFYVVTISSQRLSLIHMSLWT